MATKPAIDTDSINLKKESFYALFRIFSIKTE